MPLAPFRYRELFVLVAVAIVATSCRLDRQPQIEVGVDGCEACGMVISTTKEACAYYVGKELKPFCSPGCLLQDYEHRRKEDRPLPDRLFFADYSSGELQPSEGVFFLLSDHIQSVMDWGILSFSNLDAAREYLRHEDEVLVDWVGLRTARGEPDRALASAVTADGLVPTVVELRRGELVEWTLEGRELGSDLVLRLRGYERLGDLTVPASGTPVKFRLLATKPGMGFPFVRTDDGMVLGQLRVTGAHTPDEEEM